MVIAMVRSLIKTSQNSVDNLIGWIGVMFVLGAYTLVSFDVISAQTLTFQGLMFIGSVGVMFISYRRHDTQPMILNAVFALIAFISIVRIMFYL
jgi:hypothetical protein